MCAYVPSFGFNKLLKMSHACALVVGPPQTLYRRAVVVPCGVVLKTSHTSDKRVGKKNKKEKCIKTFQPEGGGEEAPGGGGGGGWEWAESHPTR